MIRLLCFLASISFFNSNLSAGESKLPPAILEVSSATLHPYPDETQLVDLGFDIPAGINFIPEGIVRSCSCLTVENADIQGAAWPAGSHQNVTFALTAGPNVGSMKSEAWIIGRVGNEPRCIAFSLVGDVAPYIDWPSGPNVVDLGDVSANDLPKEIEVALKRGGNPTPFDTVTASVASPDGLFEAKVAPTGADVWTMTVLVKKLPLSGVINAGVTLTCSGKGKVCKGHPFNRLRIGLIGPISAKPAGILFGNVIQGQQETHLIALEGAKAEDIIDITAADTERLSWHLVPGPKLLKLEVTFSAIGFEGEASGHIDIHERDNSVLRVPYVAKVLRGPLIKPPVTNKDPGF